MFASLSVVSLSLAGLLAAFLLYKWASDPDKNDSLPSSHRSGSHDQINCHYSEVELTEEEYENIKKDLDVTQYG